MEIKFTKFDENKTRNQPPALDLEYEKRRMFEVPGAWAQTRLLEDDAVGQARSLPKIYLQRAFVLTPVIFAESKISDDEETDIVAHVVLAEEFIDLEYIEFCNAADVGLGGGYIKHSTVSAEFCKKNDIKMNLFHFCRSSLNQYTIMLLNEAHYNQTPVFLSLELLWRDVDYSMLEEEIPEIWNGELIKPGKCLFVC